MNLITTGEVLHLGTYNGNPLVMAAVKATLTEACTRATVAMTIARNAKLVAACDAVIQRSGIPAHTVEFGAKGCITWSRSPVTNYRDYKATTSSSRSRNGSTGSTGACCCRRASTSSG